MSEVNISLFLFLWYLLVAIYLNFTQKVSNDLKDKIQSLPNVLEVQIGGEREEQLDIIIDKIRLKPMD